MNTLNCQSEWVPKGTISGIKVMLDIVELNKELDKTRHAIIQDCIAERGVHVPSEMINLILEFLFFQRISEEVINLFVGEISVELKVYAENKLAGMPEIYVYECLRMRSRTMTAYGYLCSFPTYNSHYWVRESYVICIDKQLFPVITQALEKNKHYILAQ
jgi:hypothetical protein